MSKTLIVGNWKMHLNTHEASILLHRLDKHIKIHRDVEVVLAPSFLTLQPLNLEIDKRKFGLAAQNAYFKDEGAYTGEISFSMLRDLVDYVIVGHSERRHVFNESLDIIRDKMAACVRNGITPILCIGETNQEKEDGETNQVLHDQLITALSNLTSEDIEDMAIAYEPVWAISSGTDFANHKVADPKDVGKIAAFIRKNIEDLYGAKAAEKTRILYGGSSNADNAQAYLSTPGINGLLPGGASLNYEEFSKMVDIAAQVNMGEAKN